MLQVNNLVGFGAGGAVLTSITQQSVATSTAQTITAPAGILAGDLLVLADFIADTGSVTAVTPTGFTNASNVTITLYRLMLSYKLAVGTEGGTSITGMNGNTFNQKVMYTFRGNVAATLLTPSTANGQATASAPTNQTVLASGGLAPLVELAAYGGSTNSFTRGFSPSQDGSQEASGGTSDLWLYYKIYNASPANVTVTMTDAGTANCLQSMYIQMA